jgi:hypothetical protein
LLLKRLSKQIDQESRTPESGRATNDYATSNLMSLVGSQENTLYRGKFLFLETDYSPKKSTALTYKTPAELFLA